MLAMCKNGMHTQSPYSMTMYSQCTSVNYELLCGRSLFLCFFFLVNKLHVCIGVMCDDALRILEVHVSKNVYKYTHDVLVVVVMLFCMRVFELDEFGVVLVSLFFVFFGKHRGACR